MTFLRIYRFLLYLGIGLPLLGVGMLAVLLGLACLIHELKDPGSDPGGFTLTVILIFLVGRLAWTLSAKGD